MSGVSTEITGSVLCAAVLVLLTTRRIRADGVAVIALVAAVAMGLLTPDQALSGLAEPVVVTIAALAVLAASVHRSGLIDLPRSNFGHRFVPKTPVRVLSAILVALLAAVSGRTGTRAAVLSRRRDGVERRGFAALRQTWLLNAACLLGGLMTIVGGVPNLLISTIRRDMIGAEFGLLAFLPAGLALLGAGLLAFVIVSLLARGGAAARQRGPTDNLRRVKTCIGELVLHAASPMVGQTIAQAETTIEGALRIVGVVREGFRRIDPHPGWILLADDLLVLDCEPVVLQSLMERYAFHAVDRPSDQTILGGGGRGIAEIVVTQSAEIVGQSARTLALQERYDITLLAIGRNDDPPRGRLRRTRLRVGDILVVCGDLQTMPSVLAGLGCLLLAERQLRTGHGRRMALPILVLLVALGLTAAGLTPLWLALLAGVPVLVATRVTTLRDVYDTIPWPGLVFLASLLPLATAVHGSPPMTVLMHWLVAHVGLVGPGTTIAATILAAMGGTVLFGAVVTVLALAPLVTAVALQAGLPADPLLIAIAIGAAVDMLDRRGIVAALAGEDENRFDLDWRAGIGVASLLAFGGTAILTMVWHA